MKGFGDAVSEGSKRETGEVMSRAGGPAPVCPIGRPERFELPTFWFVAELRPYTQQHQPIKPNKTIENAAAALSRFGWFWQQFTDISRAVGWRRWSHMGYHSWCATTWLSTGTTHLGRCFRIHEVCDYAENRLSDYARRKTTVLGRAITA